MKRSKMLRLLTPDEMFTLRLAVFERAGTSCEGRYLRDQGNPRWGNHVCSGRHTGPLDDFSVMDGFLYNLVL